MNYWFTLKRLQFLLELFYGNIINRLFKPDVLFLFYLGRGDSFTRYVFLMNKHFLKNWYGILTYLLINSVSIKLFYRKNSSYMPWSRPFSDGQNPVPPNKNLLVLFDEVFLSLCHFVFSLRICYLSSLAAVFSLQVIFFFVFLYLVIKFCS